MLLYSLASAMLSIAFYFTFFTALCILFRLYADGKGGLAATAGALPRIRQGSVESFARWTTILLAVLLTLTSAILLYAFITHEFKVEYVAQYSDRTLPLFYRITAFWAGQAGSMLFWAWAVAISGALFVLLPSYAKLSRPSKLWFCLFFFCIMGFFLLLLALWSNPFTTLDFTPNNGRGLNPLLQNPGMIFHPPLLFLGYGGFVVPGCLALAQTMSGNLHDPAHGKRLEEPWGQASRSFILIAWSLLTAGIVLGAWWAYMELGWGGYWAWDPVENASLIPWLVASAYLHTAVIGSRRGKLQRTNVFLMALTTISAFFATYLVRSGVVQSLHAFGDGGVGTPLLVFILAFLYLAVLIVLCEPVRPTLPLPDTDHAGLAPDPARAPRSFMRTPSLILCGLTLAAFLAITVFTLLHKPLPLGLLPVFCLLLCLLLVLHRTPNPEGGALEDMTSKEGLLLMVAWLLLALSFIILVATMWPVIIDSLIGLSGHLPEFLRQKLPTKPMGLEPAFYNRTCLPLFALLALLLVFCPHRKWILPASGSGFTRPRHFIILAGLALGLAAGLWFSGVRQPVALLAAASAIAGIGGIILYFASNPALLSVRSTLAAHGTHIGLLLMVLGVAFSGPYQDQHTLTIGRQQTARAGDYLIHLNELYEGESQIGPDGRPNFRFLEAELLVTNKDGKVLGQLSPQRRLYTNFENQTYAEVGTLFSLGNEIYATLLSIDDKNVATIALNINPLVNWLWIGGTIMCLLPFAGLARVRRQREDQDAPEQAAPGAQGDAAKKTGR